MIYYIFRFLFTLAFRVFYRRAYVTGLENFPKDKPLILAVNHPNSFLDGIVVGVFSPRPQYFLARGDVFKNKFAARILKSTHSIPIFRKMESRNNLEKNQETFNLCFDYLNKNKCILIFPEGLCVTNRALRTPLRKGVARISVGTLEKYPDLDLHILPVGINYTRFAKFRSELLIDYGKPIPVKDYMNSYAKDPGKTLSRITQDVEAAMRKTLVVIDDQKKAPFIESALDLYRTTLDQYPPLPWRKKIRSRLETEQTIANTLESSEEGRWKHFETKLRVLRKDLTDLGLDLHYFNQNSRFSWVFVVPLILCFPFFIVGIIYRAIPDFLTKFIRDKTVKGDEFFASVWMALGTLLHLFWAGVFIGFATGYGLLSLALILGVAFSAVISVYYVSWMKRLLRTIRWNKAHKEMGFKGTHDRYDECIELLEDLIKKKIPVTPLA